MTRRARWTRPLAALFALWFAFVIGEPGTMHQCPMHGDHGGVFTSASASSAASGHSMAAHGEHGASHHGSHGKTGPCTCVGQCCAAPALASLPTVAALVVPATIALAEPTLHVALEPAAVSPALRLPFANGPPTIA